MSLRLGRARLWRTALLAQASKPEVDTLLPRPETVREKTRKFLHSAKNAIRRLRWARNVALGYSRGLCSGRWPSCVGVRKVTCPFLTLVNRRPNKSLQGLFILHFSKGNPTLTGTVALLARTSRIE